MREAFDRGGDAWFGGPRADRRVLLCLARRPQSRCWRLQWSAVHGGSWSGGAYVQQAPRDPCLPPPRSQGFAVGMHAALQINPYYGKTSAAGLLRHLQAVLDEGPAIVYNVPGRTGQDIPTDVVLALAQHLNFLGVKECTGNGRIERYYEHGVLCWSGNDDEAHAGRHLHHAQGVISVTSNLLPGVFARLMQHRDDALADSLQDLIAWLFCEPNPIPLCALASGGGGRHERSGAHAQAHMPPPPPPPPRRSRLRSNTAMAMCGLVKPVFRLPYVPLSREQRQRGVPLLEAVAEHIPGCRGVRAMEDEEFTLTARY